MLEFDPYSYEIHEDPYPTYRRLRDEAPAYYNEKRGFWALSRYDDVRTALNDWRTFTSTQGITLEPLRKGTEPHIIEMDPPRHTRLRALVSRAFTPNRMARLEEPIRARARALIEPFAPTGRVDLIGDFAALLPMAVISEMLGVPAADQDRLRHAADALLHREPDSDEITPAGIAGATTLYGYFDGLIRERRAAQPGDDLLSVLIDAEEQGHALSQSELLGFCFLLIIAGNETTTKLLGNAISWLAENADQRALVSGDPSLIPGAVEETLRYDGSTQAMARCLTADVELHGAHLRAARRCSCCSGRPTATNATGDRRPTASTSGATPPGTSRSDTASTTASAPRSRGSRPGSRSKSCCRCSATTTSSGTVRVACTRATCAVSPACLSASLHDRRRLRGALGEDRYRDRLLRRSGRSDRERARGRALTDQRVERDEEQERQHDDHAGHQRNDGVDDAPCGIPDEPNGCRATVHRRTSPNHIVGPRLTSRERTALDPTIRFSDDRT